MIRSFRLGEELYIVQSHYAYYNKEYQFDLSFKQFLQDGVEQFIQHYDEAKDHLWVVEVDGQLKGSIAIRHASGTDANLRWYLIDQELKGQGYGKQLLETAIRFCRDKNYETITLWTNNKLIRARQLYSQYGFELVEEKEQFLSNQVLVTECLVKQLRTSTSCGHITENPK